MHRHSLKRRFQLRIGGIEFFLLLCVLMQYYGLSAKADPPKLGVEEVVGTWRLESLVIDGVKYGPESMQSTYDCDIVISQHESILRGHGSEIKTEVDWLPGKNPKQFRAKYVGTDKERQKLAEKGYHGIYKIEGDRLIRCFTTQDRPLPKGFVSMPGSKETVMVLKRKIAPKDK